MVFALVKFQRGMKKRQSVIAPVIIPPSEKSIQIFPLMGNNGKRPNKSPRGYLEGTLGIPPAVMKKIRRMSEKSSYLCTAETAPAMTENAHRTHPPRRSILVRWDPAGNLGQVSTLAHDRGDIQSRFLFWTEDSRLHTVVDDRHHSYYAYDHAGERTLKVTGRCDRLDINAWILHTVTSLRDHTVYPSPYVVLSNHGYTKHYYAGSERLAARLGGGFDRPILREQTDIAMTATHLFKQSQHHTNERHLNAPPAHTIRREGHLERVFRGMEIEFAIPEAVRAEVHLDPEGLIQAAQNIVSDNTEPDVYFYHSDHLGSASWITDGDGIPVQHLQYLPYGEPFVNQRAAGSTYRERFTFTGKERDEETGYSYFGARYMDHELMTMWLSVDPMSDKYPSISPYAYCAWNPIKLVDPDGREITLWIEDGSGNIYEYKPNMTPTGDAAAQQQIQTLNEMYSSSLGQEMLDALIGSTNDYYITNESTGVPGTSATVQYGNGSRSKMGGANDMLNMSHELFHAFQYENGEGGATYKNEVEALIYSNALTLQTKGTALKQLASLNPRTSDGNNFENAMNGLLWGKTFSQTDFSTAVDLFQSQSIMNSSGIYNAKYYTKGDPSNGSLLQRFYPLMR